MQDTLAFFSCMDKLFQTAQVSVEWITASRLVAPSLQARLLQARLLQVPL